LTGHASGNGQRSLLAGAGGWPMWAGGSGSDPALIALRHSWLTGSSLEGGQRTTTLIRWHLAQLVQSALPVRCPMRCRACTRAYHNDVSEQRAAHARVAVNRDPRFVYGTHTASNPVAPTGESIILHFTVG
jgi:hypothetical protein